MKNKPITAKELMDRLNSDPEFVAKREMREAAFNEQEKFYRHAEAPLIEELKQNGLFIKSVWDLVNTTTPYNEALPILLKHLPKPYPAAIREGIARALATPKAKFGWNVITNLFKEEQDEQIKDGLAVAIAAIADDELIDEVISLAKNNEYGSSRILLLRAIGKSRVPYARAALNELAFDPELKQEAQIILKRIDRRKS